MITDEDADRIARAQTKELGRNLWRGCGIFLAMFIIATVVLTLLMLR